MFEKDFDEMILIDLNYSSNLIVSFILTNLLLGRLQQIIQAKVKANILPLYLSLVRPHSECEY